MEECRTAMKIYTRTGDDGTTGLFTGERVSKTHERVDAYGAVDELNSLLGVARTAGPHPAVDARIETVQRQLFTLGADLATPGEGTKVARIGAAEVGWLEAEIDAMTAELPALRHFILPGGTAAGAQIHVARTVCRRAERQTLRMSEPAAGAVGYLNRLSDFLFTLARYENWATGVGEAEWRA